MSNWHWETKDGETLHVRDMESSHLKNCMGLIEKRNFSYTERLGFIDSEGGDFDENEIDMRPLFENINLELRLRKLEGR